MQHNRDMLFPTFKTGIIPEQFSLGSYRPSESKFMNYLWVYSSYLHRRKGRLKWYKAKQSISSRPKQRHLRNDCWWLMVESSAGKCWLPSLIGNCSHWKPELNLQHCFFFPFMIFYPTFTLLFPEFMAYNNSSVSTYVFYFFLSHVFSLWIHFQLKNIFLF